MTQPLLLTMPDSDIASVAASAATKLNISCTAKGTIAEKLFEVGALRRGWYVASNTGAGNDFDSIIKRPWMRDCIVIQTRQACLKPDGSYFINLGTKGQTQRYSGTAFDVLAVYLPDTDEIVFFTRAEMGNRIGATYTRPSDRRKPLKRYGMASRDPNNWSLLDEVAESLTAHQKSFAT